MSKIRFGVAICGMIAALGMTACSKDNNNKGTIEQPAVKADPELCDTACAKEAAMKAAVRDTTTVNKMATYETPEGLPEELKCSSDEMSLHNSEPTKDLFGSDGKDYSFQGNVQTVGSTKEAMSDKWKAAIAQIELLSQRPKQADCTANLIKIVAEKFKTNFIVDAENGLSDEVRKESREYFAQKLGPIFQENYNFIQASVDAKATAEARTKSSNASAQIAVLIESAEERIESIDNSVVCDTNITGHKGVDQVNHDPCTDDQAAAKSASQVGKDWVVKAKQTLQMTSEGSNVQNAMIQKAVLEDTVSSGIEVNSLLSKSLEKFLIN